MGGNKSVEIKELSQQHTEMLDQIQDIRALLGLVSTKTLAADIGQRLDVLAASLGLHLSVEDREFYPAALISTDEKVRTTAERFYVEMGHLRRAFGNYREAWKSDKAIHGSFPLFAEDTQRVFALLEKRVRLEEEHLYPLWKAPVTPFSEGQRALMKENNDSELTYFNVMNSNHFRMKT